MATYELDLVVIARRNEKHPMIHRMLLISPSYNQIIGSFYSMK